MAYSRRTSGRKTYRSTAARTTSRRRSGAGRKTSASRTTRRGSASPRTIRIVVETAAVNPVQRPDLGLVAARKPRQPQFV